MAKDTWFERNLEWAMTKWGFWTTDLMWSDYRVLRALGLVMAIAATVVLGILVALWVMVDSAKKKWCPARSVSR